MVSQPQPKSSLGNRSVALELLRTGTPYNQTLSPGITYLAVCGTHPPAEFRVNLEQFKFVRYLRLLRYQAGLGSSMQLAKEALQDILTGVFEVIPALQMEAGVSEGWLHLRLVMTPRELAMLPFELALTPTGFQGARDKPFLLNQQRLTTLTREVRQVAPRTYTWPAKPRILFAWAAPKKAVPSDEHVAVLRDAIAPWVRPKQGSLELEADESPLLTILPEARPDQLRAAVVKAVQEGNPYTHVHILAHGMLLDDPDTGQRFGLAMHLPRPTLAKDGTTTQTDRVDAARLTDALVVVHNDRTYRPAVITLMACDGGNEGTNMAPGGSLAYALHMSGVPYVLASQFPLSVEGSVQLIRDLYPRLLHGEDPRIALYYARNAISQGDFLDWASLVAYARFPDDLEEQLDKAQLQLVLEMMKTATAWTDYLLAHPPAQQDTYTMVQARLDAAIGKLEDLLSQRVGPVRNPARLAEHLGLLGSAYKRQAEFFFQFSTIQVADADWSAQSKIALARARDCYQRGHNLLLTNHWTGIQHLSLVAIGQETLEAEHDRWCVVLFAAEQDLQNSTDEARTWALGTLVELYLLQPFTKPTTDWVTSKQTALDKACRYVDELAQSGQPFAIESTARQLNRYVKWWANTYPSALTAQLSEMATQLLKRLTPA
ncbi:CHAT domain-containing protein [Fibrella aquatilis]|uniref:CHAT domain-containing protein n=1 Tax=Fibrella aquatilis TaxID=2817059 RepID=A0A939G8Z4_9BACT|nr:CHAT domain-containing protein [Fibrella aquatilis]MBO0932535.1 CHAT domain-containing protein [Fibrella aquatilis]